MSEEKLAVGKRLDDLKRKLAAREGKSEFVENVKALKAEIAKLEAQERDNG